MTDSVLSGNSLCTLLSLGFSSSHWFPPAGWFTMDSHHIYVWFWFVCLPPVSQYQCLIWCGLVLGMCFFYLHVKPVAVLPFSDLFWEKGPFHPYLGKLGPLHLSGLVSLASFKPSAVVPLPLCISQDLYQVASTKRRGRFFLIIWLCSPSLTSLSCIQTYCPPLIWESWFPSCFHHSLCPLGVLCPS